MFMQTAEVIQTVSGSTFKASVLEGAGPIAVEFMSYGCAHCRALEPILQQAADKVKAQEHVFRVNVAVERELAERYQIEGTPTLVMFLNGQEVGRTAGPHPTLSGVMSAITGPFDSIKQGL
jgi:thioredoxin 1